MIESVNDVDHSDRQRVGAILWRGKYIILASVIVFVALAVAYTSTQSKVYQATADLQVNVVSSTPNSNDATATNQGLAQNYATLLVAPGLLDTIRGKLEGGKLSTATLQSRLSATALPSTALVQLSANGPSPEAAQKLAQEVSNGFLSQLQSAATQRTTQLQAQDEQAVINLSSEIAKLQGQNQTPSTQRQIASLKASLQALTLQNEALVASGLAQGTSATLSAPPVASQTPISPRKSLNILGGLILGLVVGVALAFIRNMLRPELQTADDVAATVGLPILATIPLKPKLKSEDPAVVEAYRILSTTLSFSMRDSETQVLTIAGFSPQVGKTSVVRGLAEAMTERGQNVLMVDGDMRAASLSNHYGYGKHPGLADVLQVAIDLDVAIVPLRQRLSLLPARQSRSNAASLLSGGRMAGLIPQLRKRYDLILFDSPPMAALADALILSSLSDLVVFVARTGLTRSADLKAAAASLTQGYTPIAGMVVFEDVERQLYYPEGSNSDHGIRRSRALSRADSARADSESRTPTPT
jgi:capsular exopolysaccharide synthesis family protein